MAKACIWNCGLFVCEICIMKLVCSTAEGPPTLWVLSGWLNEIYINFKTRPLPHQTRGLYCLFMALETLYLSLGGKYRFCFDIENTWLQVKVLQLELLFKSSIWIMFYWCSQTCMFWVLLCRITCVQIFTSYSHLIWRCECTCRFCDIKFSLENNPQPRDISCSHLNFKFNMYLHILLHFKRGICFL